MLLPSEYHSTGGPLKVTVPEKTELGERLLQAGRELGFSVLDPNGDSMIGT